MKKILTHTDLAEAMKNHGMIIAVDRVGKNHKRLHWQPYRVLSGYIIDAKYQVFHNGNMIYETVSWSQAVKQYNEIALEATDDT